jgi:DNA-binding LacI/PurR family transcriptional regulator
MRTLLDEHPSLTGVVVTSEVLGAGAMQAIREKALRIPEDFSVVVITSSHLAEMMTPPLTGVELPATEMGRIGAELLIRRLEDGKQPPTQLILPAALTVRHSTAQEMTHRSWPGGVRQSCGCLAEMT